MSSDDTGVLQPLLNEEDEQMREVAAAAEPPQRTASVELLRALPRARELRGRTPGLASWTACLASVVLLAIQSAGDTALLEQFLQMRSIQYQLPVFGSAPAWGVGSTHAEQSNAASAPYQDTVVLSDPSLLREEPVPIPDPNPKPPHQSPSRRITEFFHDYFFLFLLSLVILEVFVLPKTGLSWAVRSSIAFTLCSALIAIAQGIASMFVYWLIMGLILFVFYGDILTQLAAIRRQAGSDDDR